MKSWMEKVNVLHTRNLEKEDLGEYQRLIRILLQNLQTGSRGLCKLLEQESENALEERKALACKLGERGRNENAVAAYDDA